MFNGPPDPNKPNGLWSKKESIDLTGEGEYLKKKSTGSEAEQPCLTIDSIGFEVDPESVKNFHRLALFPERE